MRDYKYDNLKCLLIFLVVFGHFLEFNFGAVNNFIYCMIYSFHMLLFAYISGRFTSFKKQNILRNIKLYFVFQFIYTALDIALFKFDSTYPLKMELSPIDIIIEYFVYPNHILWFLFCLILWTLFVFILDKIKAKFLVVFPISLILCFLIGFLDIDGYSFSFFRLITFFPFFYLGYSHKGRDDSVVLMKHRDNFLFLISNVIVILFISFFSINFKSIGYYNFYGSYHYHNIFEIFIRIVWIVSGFAICFLLTRGFENKKIPIVSYLGKNSIFIYLGHSFFIKTFYLFSEKLLTTNSLLNILILFLFSIATVSICGGFGYFCNNFKLKK